MKRKTRKKVLTALAVIVVWLVLIFLAGRYGWRLFGFRLCGGSGIEEITVTAENAEIKGFYAGSFPRGCVGTVTKQNGGTLYLGVRYSGLFGFFERGQFDITVPLKEPITEIILKTGNDEYPIWNAADDPARMTEGFFGETDE